MTTEKIFIKNRKDQKISVLVEIPEHVKGLVFVMHGLGGFKEQLHIVTMAKAFLDHGFIAVRFDTTNTFGESDGDYADATLTNYYEDLEDVIAWAKTQSWFQSPFALAGHSLGGYSTARYAELHPHEVCAVAPISAVVSGGRLAQSEPYQKVMKEWKETGWRITESVSKPGTMKRLKYAFIEDLPRHDLLPDVANVTMPILMIVGELDAPTPYREQKVLFDAVPGEKKELHIISGAEHTFRKPGELEELSRLFNDWLRRL